MIPVLDIAGWTSSSSGGDSNRDAIASAFDAACREYGFLQITGHGVDRAVVDGALGAMDDFFLRSFEDKVVVRPDDHEINRGYSPMGTEALSYSTGRASHPDLLEAFEVGPDAPDLADPAVLAEREGAGVFAANVWPDEGAVPGFRTAINAYFEVAAGLARRMTEVAAVALGLPDDHFVPYLTHSTETMRLNHYLRRSGDPVPEDGQLRLGAHTDYGVLTVLYGDAVPGLEVLTLGGSWLPVTPMAGAFVINLGDLLAMWTNDRWRSTLHRVVPPPADPGADGPAGADGLHSPDAGARRRSLAFFFDGNHDARIECLPTCCSPDEPPKYPPVLAGDHLKAKFLSGRTLSTDRYDPVADPAASRLASLD
jgi:isopenicillin N synthase-like dioxygenase